MALLAFQILSAWIYGTNCEYHYSHFHTSQVLGVVLSVSDPGFCCQDVATGCSSTKLLRMRGDTNERKSETWFSGIKGRHSISSVSGEEDWKNLS